MSWNNLRLDDPLALLLLPLSLGAWWWWKQRRGRQESISFPWLGLISLPAQSQIRLWLRRIALSCVAVGWCLWILALARPQRVDETKRTLVSGVDIALVLDTSASMIIEDLPPNRLTVALEEISKFIQEREHDRLGLIVFGGEAFTLVPLTLDHELLTQSLQRIEPDMTKAEGTAIGTALATAVTRLKGTLAKSKIIVLLTDGESNLGTVDPVTAADLAAHEKIKIHSIGIGRDGPVMMPFMQQDLLGRQVKRYQRRENSTDFSLLESLSQKTGGVFFRATDGEGLTKIFEEIDKLERVKIEGLKRQRVTELFSFPLMIGTWLLGVAQLLLFTLLRVSP